jgi:hypothetical protein
VNAHDEKQSVLDPSKVNGRTDRKIATVAFTPMDEEQLRVHAMDSGGELPKHRPRIQRLNAKDAYLSCPL